MKQLLLLVGVLSFSPCAFGGTHVCSSYKQVLRPRTAQEFNSLQFIFEDERDGVTPYFLRNSTAVSEIELTSFQFPHFRTFGSLTERGTLFKLGQVANMALDLGFKTEEPLRFEVSLKRHETSYKGYFFFRNSSGDTLRFNMSCERLDTFNWKEV